jgi:hypothetical protein
MDFEEKMRLAEAIHTLPPHRLAEIVSIVARSVEPREEIEIDIDLLSQDVLLEIKRVVDDEVHGAASNQSPSEALILLVQKISTEPASRGATD